jgi:hypothetical protein
MEKKYSETLPEKQAKPTAEVYLFHHYLASLKCYWRPKAELELIEKIHTEFKNRFNLNHP